MGLFEKVSKYYRSGEINPIFKNITLKDMNQKQIKFEKVLRDNKALLKVLRRVGCPITRYECKLISEMKSYFDVIGLKLIAITFEENEAQRFYLEGYWQGDLLIDKDRTLYNALELYNQSEEDSLADLFSYSGIIAKRLAIGSKVRSGFGGDPFQLGGTFVIEKGGNLTYEFRQKAASVFPSIKEIYSAAGGDPELVEEIVPKECIYYLNSSNEHLKCNQWVFSKVNSKLALNKNLGSPVKINKSFGQIRTDILIQYNN